jgi:fatty acid amide hydrolase 2
MSDLLTLSASALARHIRARDLTSREVVEAHITRALAINPTINAIVAPRFEQARLEAEHADRLARAADPHALPPLHGVPCSIKESFQLTGMPNASGLVSRAAVRAQHDAPTVARLRRAGAIPIGVTNTPELCMWYETHNQLYGRTSNPYNPAHTAGGSSGGEGAIVGAGAAPFGLGSDIGGSIRMPALFNGVFGHKPSAGLVPNTGQFPIASGPARRYLCTGPICRRAEDLWPLLSILAGPDGHDAVCNTPLPTTPPDQVDLSTLDVVLIASNELIAPSAEIDDACERAADHLRRRGARVRTQRLPELKHSLSIWSALMGRQGGPSFEQLMTSGGQLHIARELARLPSRRSPHTLPALVLALIERAAPLLDRQFNASLEAFADLKAKIDALLTPHTILLHPSFPCPAPRHLRPLLMPAHFAYSAIFNVLELPATQVPMGLTPDGLPVGLQIVARHGHDHLSIAAACALEHDAGGWTPPWTVTKY